MGCQHLFSAGRMVRDTCRAEGIAYTETTIVEAYRVVLRYMRTVGRSAPRVFECPIVFKFGRI